MNLKPSDISSLITSISQKKCSGASVNTHNGGEGLGDNYVPNGDICL